MTNAEIVTALAGRSCRCSRFKPPGMTFCRHCYYSLPEEYRHGLYRRMGSGYEKAYRDAVDVLDETEKP